MLTELLNDHRTAQDATQLGTFVLGGRTEWGTYKQSLRELYKRIRGLRQMITDRDLADIDKEELSDRINGEDERDARRAQIEMRALDGRIEELDRSIRDTKREAALFYRVASEVKSELGEITEERRAELDRQEWRWWHLKRAAIAKIGSGRVDNTTLKNLCALPIAEREEWLSVIKDDDALIRMLEQSEYGRQENFLPSADEIKQIEMEVSKCS